MLLVVVLVGLAFTNHRLYSISGIIDEPVQIDNRINMQTKTTKWCDKQGVEHSISTTREPNETIQSWCARHDEAVEAMQQTYPPKEQ